MRARPWWSFTSRPTATYAAAVSRPTARVRDHGTTLASLSRRSQVNTAYDAIQAPVSKLMVTRARCICNHHTTPLMTASRP
jgi:hypothetical protein